MADKHVDAYFKSEDDALDTQTKLEIAGAKDYTIEEIPQDEGGLTFPAIAYAGSGAGTSGGVIGGGAVGTTGAGGIGLAGFFGFFDDEDDITERNMMSSFVIEDDKYEEALNIIKEGGGKVYD